MLFNSINFLIFFPLVTLVYFLIPHRIRYIWLLITSYYFYMCWNPEYALLMLTSTAITYAAGILIDLSDKRKKEKHKKIWVALSFISNLTILFVFKYFDFAVENINRILSAFNITLLNPSFDLLLPVGISFYTFQALGYTIDVYRKDVAPEKNFLRYALFVSFFPQLVAGPIERSSNLIHQLRERHYFVPRRIVRGMALMLWGFFLKLVIADRAAVFVNTVYNNPQAAAHSGLVIVIATVLFSFQIYCDFASYSDIARGAAEVLGITLMRNFNTPYFAESVSEFWRRWHISLSTWFRDYLYIPLGGNRKGKIRKYFNLMTVFAVSGLWHGASWNFIIWGALNGAYQVIGEIFHNLSKWIVKAKEKEKIASKKLFRIGVTFCLIGFSWIFFRANTWADSQLIIKKMFSEFNPWILFDGTIFTFGLDRADMLVLCVALLILFCISIAKYSQIELREWLFKQGICFRYLIYLIAIFIILIWGIYGPLYDASQFIYFQF